MPIEARIIFELKDIVTVRFECQSCKVETVVL